MKASLNTPYRKLSGFELTKANPYITQGQNRAERRRKNPPFISNGKNIALTVSGNYKYLRYIQSIFDKKTGELKKINHYLPR